MLSRRFGSLPVVSLIFLGVACAGTECAVCKPAAIDRCGDGRVNHDLGELCDLGTQNSNQGACLQTCQVATCGDGLVQTDVEECDDGNTIDIDSCTNTCKHAIPSPGVRGPGLPDEGCHLDAAEIRVDPESGIHYYSNLLRVIARPALTLQEELSMLALPDVTALRCGIRAPVEDSFGFYTLRLSAGRELSALKNVATSVHAALPHVEVAPVLRQPPKIDLVHYATDLERSQWNERHGIAIAYVYARAWGARHRPQSVLTAVHDTGVCLSGLGCGSADARALGANLLGVFSPGGRFHGLAELEDRFGFPLDGSVDWENGGHGTAVAAILGDPSDGNLIKVEGEAIGNGIVAGLFGGQHRSISYIGPSIGVFADAFKKTDDENLVDTESLELWNMASACARGTAASNHSYGLDPLFSWGPIAWGETAVFRHNKVPRFALFSSCKDTLWVYAAGNAGTDVDASSLYADSKDYTGTASSVWNIPGIFASRAPDNVIGVAALDEAGNLQSFSDHGSGVRLAAQGDNGTSFAAPLVTSAAGFLAAVDPTPTAPTPTSGRGAALAALFEATGRRVDGTSSRSIDVASALLVNRALEPEVWLPFVSEELVYGGQADLGELRKDPRLKGGIHEESSTWTFDRTNNTILLRDGGKEFGSGPLVDFFSVSGHDCDWGSCDFSDWDYSFESSVTAEELWSPAVVAESDTFDAERLIPVLAMRRLGSNRRIQGLMRIQGPKPLALQETPGELGMSGLAYCLQIMWKEDPEASSAVRIPLADLGSTVGGVRSHVLRNVEMWGRIRRVGGSAVSTLDSVSCDDPLPTEIDEPSQDELDEWAEGLGAMPMEVGYVMWPDYEAPTDVKFRVRFDDIVCDTSEPGRDRGRAGVLSSDELSDPHHVLGGSLVTYIEERDGMTGVDPCFGHARGYVDIVATKRAIAIAAEGFVRSTTWATAQHLTLDEHVPWDLRSGVTPVAFERLFVGIDSFGGLFPGQWQLFEEWMFRGMLTPRPEPDPVAAWSDGVGYLREKAFPLLSARLLPRAVP